MQSPKPNPKSSLKRQSATLLLKREGRLLTIHKGSALVGRCKLYRTGNQSAILGDFIIYKRFRGLGYGSVLLSEVLSFNLKLILWVAADNIPAQNLYAKFGFKEIGVDGNRKIMFLDSKDSKHISIQGQTEFYDKTISLVGKVEKDCKE